MKYRLRVEPGPEHCRIKVFVAPKSEATFALAGILRFRVDEAEGFLNALGETQARNVEVEIVQPEPA